jgi:4-amino-4-deoxy-L-arabinose transferase-like glycosyltransferase
MATSLAIRLLWAAGAPLSNDESYYWDWSRSMQLSYFDHPPGVAWLAWLASRVCSGALAARGAVVFVHLLGVWLMLRCSELIKGARLDFAELITLLVMTELVPVFSFEGLLLLPDAGLLAALAASLYCFLSAGKAFDLAERGKGGPWFWAIVGGLAIGLAGLFKYHAAPVAAGLGLGLLWCWGVHRWRQWLGWICICAAVALVVAAPVLIWNAEHDWASVRYQGDHGFGGLSFSWLPALRVFFGQLLLLTPYVIVCSIKGPSRRSQSPLARIPQAAFWPLFLLLEGLAFGKQMLPHWVAPAFWMMLPLLTLSAQRGLTWRFSLALSGVVTLILPWVLVLAPLRQGLISAAKGRPGPLSELTLWQPLVETLVADARLVDLLRLGAVAPSGPANCPSSPLIASLRWFWTSQLAFHLPGQPRVLSLDLTHPSAYDFRDDLAAFAGCPVLLIGDERHFNPGQIQDALAID